MHPPTYQQNGRDERVSVIGHSNADPRGIRASTLPNHRDNSTRRSAVDTGRDAGPAPELRRIAKTIRVPTLKAPDGHGMAALLRAGKVISSQHYNFEELRMLGVELVPVDTEIVPLQPFATPAGAPSLAEVMNTLERAGMRVVPADAPPAQAAPATSPEVEQLKAENGEMRAQLAEMQKAIAELTAKKGR